jgi:hypothetical protein
MGTKCSILGFFILVKPMQIKPVLNKAKTKILVTVTQSATNVPQTNNISTSGMNEE